MPTYEYECRRCGHRFERFQPMSDPPIKRCPKCKGAVRRVPAAGAGLLFKGSGFYITDYRSSSYREKAQQEGGAKSGGGSAGGEKGGGGSGGKSGGGSAGGEKGGGGSGGKRSEPKTPPRSGE